MSGSTERPETTSPELGSGLQRESTQERRGGRTSGSTRRTSVVFSVMKGTKGTYDVILLDTGVSSREGLGITVSGKFTVTLRGWCLWTT